MISCQRCGQPLSPNTPTCPRCGAPVSPSAGWSQPQGGGMGANPFGAGPASPYGAPPSPSLAYGAPQPPSQQPPRFSAGSLISDGDLPEWLRESADGHGAPAPQPAAWGAPAQPTPPAPGQGWAPEPQRPDIAAQHTIRQPIVGAPNPAAQNPFGQAPMNYPQQPYPPQVASPGYPAGYQAPYPQPQAYPPQQPGFAQQQQTPYSQQPGFAQPQAGYPQQPYPQQPYPQQQTPPGSINAFPGIEQAGVAYHGPQVGGMAGQALVNHQSLPNWLSGAPGQPGLGQGASQAPSSGMQARSLVDDQLLPKWLRDQPDDAGRANVSEWIGASAAQEPMPPFLNEAYAQAQVTRARQPNDGAFYQQPSPPRSGPVGGYGEDPAMPDWLRAQAQSGAGVASQANAHQQPGGFAASDLIDPAALPDWVTRRAPAAQPYSAANGWNAANPAGSMMVAPEPTYDQQGVDQGYDQQGFDQQGYDQQGYDQQGYDQEPAPWGASGAQDDQDYGQQSRSEQRYGRGQPLAADELPSWLRGGVGAPAARGRTPAAERNPWASAAEPMDSAEAWDEAEPWDEGDGQAAPGWGASGWDDGYSDGRDGGRDGGRRSDWDASEPTADWGESASRRSRGGTARRQRARPDERDDYGDDRYADARYGARQYADDDEPADDYGDYDEEPDDRAQGRGWLGFLRRDKR